MKKLLIKSILLLAVFLTIVLPAFADCPQEDLTGDCVVNLGDLAALASQWLEIGVLPYPEISRDYIDAGKHKFSTANIDASDGNEFYKGTYFVCETNEDRLCKFRIEYYQPEENHKITVEWVTYNPDGSVYSQGSGLAIRGTFSCDLDEGLETSSGKDFRWLMHDSSTRWLYPCNGAEFELLYRANLLGMEWVYIDGDPGVSGHEGFTGYMSKYETTTAQYCRYLNEALASGNIYIGGSAVDNVYGAGGVYEDMLYYRLNDLDAQIAYSYSDGSFYIKTRDAYDMSNHPVINSTYYGAMAFADCYGWSLPTEWQWQAVADYDGSYNYGCGSTIHHSKANYGEDNPVWLSEEPYTCPVGYYGEFGYGLCDMAGNAWEWTDSLYPGMEPDRVIRGGSWGSPEDGWDDCAVTNRVFGGSTAGFRVVRP